MKQFWHELCTQAYVHRFEILALLLVMALWVVLAMWVIPKPVLDAVVYFAFGWLLLGDVVIPWTTRKLKQLFN